jgi:hypothetical protein
LFLLLVGMACLFPVSMYCLFLALLHHRRQPTMLSGAWDFVGVLAALAGFLLIGATTLVFAFHSAARDFWLRGDSLADLRKSHTQAGTVTFLIWGLYFLIIVVGAVYLLRQRSQYTVIYNISPSELDAVMASLFDRLALPFTRRGTQLYIDGGPTTKSARLLVEGNAPASGGATPNDKPGPNTVVDVDGSAAMRYVSLHWRSTEPEMRRELEAELAVELEGYETGPNPVSGWFVTASGSLMLMMIFFLATFVMAWWLRK